MSPLELRPVSLTSAVAELLLGHMVAFLAERYPEYVPPALEPSTFEPPRGRFLVAELDGEPVGCGGVRPCDVEGVTGELKRIWVEPERRGLGIARAILAALEDEARGLGYTRILLETGMRQQAAMRLYERAGYATVANVATNPLNRVVRSYEKALVERADDRPSAHGERERSGLGAHERP